MHTSKLAAAALAVALVAGGVTLLFGSAGAAAWHTYEGDIYAGHAYGLTVPAGAQSYEILLTGDAPEKAAKVAVFNPAGEKLGFYSLASTLPSAAVIEPVEGRHMIYVYEVTGGALNLRVNSEVAPPLSLDKLRLAREDLPIGEGDGARFDKAMTATLKSTPVFVTLLYEGSVQNLDATVASAKGDVVTVTDETGTAFSPGVWSSSTGTRTSDAANLDGLTYTVTVHADSFEGTLSLTSLSLALDAPIPMQTFKPVPPEAVKAPAAVSSPVEVVFADVGHAIEITAAAGKLTLVDAGELAAPEEHDHEHVDDNQTTHDHAAVTSFVASVYAPDDTLLAYLDTTSDHGAAEVELPEEGAYVVYVHRATNDAVALQLAAPATSVRDLALVEETFAIYPSEATTIELARAPVQLSMRFTDDSIGALSSASLENEKGQVAYADGLASLGPLQLPVWSASFPENFQAGEHVLYVSTPTPVGVEIFSVAFDRTAVVEPVEPEAAEPAPEEPAEPEEPSEPEEPEEPEAPEEESSCILGLVCW